MVGRRQVCGWHFAIDCLTNKEPPSGIARVPPPPLLSLFLLRSSLLIKNGASLPQLFLPFLFSINELLRQTISSRFIETSEKETTLLGRERPFRKLSEEEEEEEERKMAITISGRLIAGKRTRVFSTRIRRLDAQLRLFDLSLTSRVWWIESRRAARFPPFLSPSVLFNDPASHLRGNRLILV